VRARIPDLGEPLVVQGAPEASQACSRISSLHAHRLLPRKVVDVHRWARHAGIRKALTFSARPLAADDHVLVLLALLSDNGAYSRELI
jgi:hypothetical protein